MDAMSESQRGHTAPHLDLHTWEDNVRKYYFVVDLIKKVCTLESY